jgi:hypothetical protein
MFIGISHELVLLLLLVVVPLLFRMLSGVEPEDNGEMWACEEPLL